MKKVAVTDSWIDFSWSSSTETFGDFYIQIVRFPQGSWFSHSYIDRRKKKCCRVRIWEVTLFNITLNIERY